MEGKFGLEKKDAPRESENLMCLTKSICTFTTTGSGGEVKELQLESATYPVLEKRKRDCELRELHFSFAV